MLDLILAASLYFTPNSDSPVCEAGQVSEIDDCTQGQLPEETIGREYEPTDEASQLPNEQIGRIIDGDDGRQYVVIGIDENGCPILQLMEKKCDVALDRYGRVILDEHCNEFSFDAPPVVDEVVPTPVPVVVPEPAVTPAPVVEIADAVVPEPTPVPQLASTGVPVAALVSGILLLLGSGIALVSVSRRKRTDA